MSTNGRDPFDVDLDVSLSDLVDRRMLTELCESFFPLIGAPLRVFDSKNQQLAAIAPEQGHAVCQEVQRFESGRKACRKIKHGLQGCSPTADCDHEKVSCFCGLRYTVVPLKFQGRVLGKLSVGPYPVTAAVLDQVKLSEAVPELSVDDFAIILSATRTQPQDYVERFTRTMVSSIELILFSAQKAHAMTQAHLASLKETHKELTAKNRELQEKNERLGELEKLKSSFLATVSHELRTPLTSIIGYSDALYDGIAGTLGEEQREFIATIRNKGEELLRLITSILDFSRVDAGRIELEVADLSARELVEQAVDQCRAIAERRGVHLTYDPLDSLPTISVDPDKMRTAIGHLIDNAVKFSSPGSLVRVEVRVSDGSDEVSGDEEFGFVLLSAPRNLEINVVDHGVGIRQADQRRIFDAFAQGDSSSTREHGGAGLGLAIVRSYVEAHGGRVLVESAAGEGSRFCIRLPLVE